VAVSLARQRVRTAWWFLMPLLAVLLLVAGWPLARTIWFSFTDASLMAMGEAHWVGLENYLARYDGAWEGVLADPLWWQAVRNTLWFVLVSVSLETGLGLAIALVLQWRFPARPLLRAAVLVPWAIPTIVSAKMWGWLLHDQFGLVNDLLLRIGIVGAPLAWTADPGLAMNSVIIAEVWKTTPFMALLLLAALQMLPADYHEAARLDGVNAWRRFWHITLPLIRPALVVAVTFRALDALRIFDLIYVLTPNNPETVSMSVYARQQLVVFQDVGAGSAASTLLFFTIALCTIAFLALARRRGEVWR
jgi:trehalose/maltose transport system permease protein